jgi:hypothetical protein
MSRARDDARKNKRRQFATMRDDGEPVGSFWIGHADGCQEGFTEDGDGYSAAFAETHEPGSHDELHQIIVEPRRRSARLRRERVPA